MLPNSFRQIRQRLRLTQSQLADRLHITRMTVTRYECGTRRIPGVVEAILSQLDSPSQIPMVGVVAAGNPIEPIAQSELVEVPPSMLPSGDNFALRVKGESMRDEGILPGDLVVVHKQQTARNGQTVVALVNHDATIKKYYLKENQVELHPANTTMAPIIVTSSDEFVIEGVVIGVIRHCG